MLSNNRRFRRLLAFSLEDLRFWAIVGLPTLLAAVYYFTIAADLYSSEARFQVRDYSQNLDEQIQQTGMTGRAARAAVILGGDPSNPSQDAGIAQAYLLSRDAVRRLEQEIDLRTLLRRPESDIISRFPGLRLLWRDDFEALFSAYGRFVSVDVGADTGVITLQVKAYRPEDAQLISQALLRYAEELVNALNRRAEDNTLALFQREVDDVEHRVAIAQAALTAYRVKENMLDPTTAVMGTIPLLDTMSALLVDAKAQLAETLRNTPSSPQVPLIMTRINSLEQLIDDQRALVTGSAASVATILDEYLRLDLQRMFAQKELDSAYGSRETARIETERQQLYFQTIAEPAVADYPRYPLRIISVGIVVAISLCIYGITFILIAKAH